MSTVKQSRGMADTASGRGPQHKGLPLTCLCFLTRHYFIIAFKPFAGSANNLF